MQLALTLPAAANHTHKVNGMPPEPTKRVEKEEQPTQIKVHQLYTCVSGVGVVCLTTL